MGIKEYQKRCFKFYKAHIGYPLAYTYLYGTPINVQLPIETVQNKVMIVGAYPSAKFYSIKKDDGKYEHYTPLADNDAPFSSESYFDGLTVRTIPSGRELNEVILNRLEIDRQDCWITDLVKVFLFKKGHVEKYRSLGKSDIESNRNLFGRYANASLEWLNEEIEICNPYVIILLGVDVACAVLTLKSDEAIKTLDGNVQSRTIKGKERNFICLPHPGILMRRQKGNDWPENFERSISKVAKANVKLLKEASQTKIADK